MPSKYDFFCVCVCVCVCVWTVTWKVLTIDNSVKRGTMFVPRCIMCKNNKETMDRRIISSFRVLWQ